MKKKDTDVPNIKAHHSKDEWIIDPKGFFTIKPFPKEGVIKVRHYTNKHELLRLIIGKSALEIYYTIHRLGLVSSLHHASYLGAELQRAEDALKNNTTYVQG